MKPSQANVWRVTSLGFMLGASGVIFKFWPLLLLSLAADVADGALARRWNVASAEGARLDWTVDCALAGALLASIPVAWTAIAVITLMSIWIYACKYDKRVSGRSLMTLVFIVSLLNK